MNTIVYMFAVPRFLRLTILALGIFVLAADTLNYYVRAAELETRTDLTDVIEKPIPSPVLSPTLQAKPISDEFASRLVSFELIKTIEKPLIEAAQTSFTGQVLPSDISQVLIYALEYQIVGRDGEWKPMYATVYFPVWDQQVFGNETYPLYVFGSGTTGLADKCAPSLENVAVENLGNYENHMIAQAAAGYVAVLPDYEGYNDPTATEAYFIVESEAKVLLGAITRLYELQTNPVVGDSINFEQVFMGGYSQGGHAALAAAQHWAELPSGIRLRGILQFAGAGDVEALFFESPHLAAYLTASFADYYAPSLQAEDVLQDKWLGEMPRNNELLCVNQAYQYFPRDPQQIYTPAFMDALESTVWPELLQNWQGFIQLNTPFSQLPDVPYLSIQGEADPIVTAKTQRENVSILCQQGKKVLYREYPGVNHFQIRQVSFVLSDAWMKDVLNGRPFEISCP